MNNMSSLSSTNMFLSDISHWCLCLLWLKPKMKNMWKIIRICSFPKSWDSYAMAVVVIFVLFFLILLFLIMPLFFSLIFFHILSFGGILYKRRGKYKNILKLITSKLKKMPLQIKRRKKSYQKTSNIEN